MTSQPPNPIPPTAPEFYDEHYYARQLHARHWFRNNEAKFRERWQAVLQRLALAPDDVVVDLGCANGEHTLRFAGLVRRAIGIDFSEAAVRLARQRADAAGSRAEFMQADVARLEAIASGSVHKVAALDLVEHIEDDTLDAALAEVWRILAPGGRFVFYTPSASHYVERLKARNLVLRQLPGHIAVRDAAAYRRALSAQPWASVEISHLPSSYPVFGWIDRLLMRLPGVGGLFRFRICGMARKA